MLLYLLTMFTLFEYHFIYKIFSNIWKNTYVLYERRQNMKTRTFTIFMILLCAAILTECKEEKKITKQEVNELDHSTFGSNIVLSNLDNYSNQFIPNFIKKTNFVQPNDAKATLGRILFYDKNLSVDNSVSCGSCHKQELGFGDVAVSSVGVEGALTMRHTMRLVNLGFTEKKAFFWDKAQADFYSATTRPISEHNEMGYSGLLGRQNMTLLIKKLQEIDYYNKIFKFVYGESLITELRLQESLVNFISSIQSFDSKYDAGRAQVATDLADFPNFSAEENLGKKLFMSSTTFDSKGNRMSGGLNCASCHKGPEFNIDLYSGNNGITSILNGSGKDLSVTRSPSIRDITNSAGELNGPLMHTGEIKSLNDLLTFYESVPIDKSNYKLDERLSNNGEPQHMKLTSTERAALIAFLKTLSGKNLYTDKKWSNPFL